jgi:hypothetical protein
VFVRFLVASSLFFCFITQTEQLASFGKIISLGSDCEVATQLNKYKLRHEAYPFDWMRTYVFSKLTQLIQNNFAHFLHGPLLVKGHHSVTNKLYFMAFVHDFPTRENPSYERLDEEFAGIIIPNFVQFLPQVREKYARRIARFKKALYSNEPILFIRSQHIQPHEAAEFVQLISRLNPKLNFTLAVVSGQNHPKEQWYIPHVIALQETKPPKAQWFSDAQWATILKKLNVIS